ncbi:MAG TPA: TetR/AcrR family transcriptional regulator [Thermoanaerobaculia bacterium]|jgi:AcrR family transcriptional regulator|nr:TetR/AcrR family transcriptional regulator [Thermoanaerobaculia bacterium]
MPTSARRDELLEATVRYLLQNGVAELSLRPLAAAVGSKARLLVYHFGSKEQLLVEAMGLIRSRAKDALEVVMTAQAGDADLDVLVRALWKWATSTRNRPYLRLFFEMHGLALQYPSRYASYLQGSIDSWIDLLTSTLTRALGRARAATMATLIVGVIDGLLLDALATGDWKRTGRAVNEFAAQLSQKRRSGR